MGKMPGDSGAKRPPGNIVHIHYAPHRHQWQMTVCVLTNNKIVAQMITDTTYGYHTHAVCVGGITIAGSIFGIFNLHKITKASSPKGSLPESQDAHEQNKRKVIGVFTFLDMAAILVM